MEFGSDMKYLKHTASVILFLGSLSNPLLASASDINVDGARPLNEALWVINERFRQPVIYEEIRYESKIYLVNGGVIGLRPDRNYPKGGNLNVHFVDNEDDAYNAIETVMAAYKQRYPTIRYSTSLNSGIVCILPAEMQDATGHRMALKPVLSTRVSIPRASRSIQESVQLLASAISSNNANKTIVLEQPFRNRQVVWGADDESAVDALVKLANEIDSATIRLLFDPSDSTYYLSLTPIAPASAKPLLDIRKDKAPLTESPFFVKNKQ